MKKTGDTVEWEYNIVRYTIPHRWRAKKSQEELDAFHEVMNELGSEGWEAVGFHRGSITGVP